MAVATEVAGQAITSASAAAATTVSEEGTVATEVPFQDFCG